MMRAFGAIFGTLLVMMAWTGSVQASEERPAAPFIEVEKPIHFFSDIFQGGVVKYDFRVFNRGTAPLNIKRVKPG